MTFIEYKQIDKQTDKPNLYKDNLDPDFDTDPFFPVRIQDPDPDQHKKDPKHWIYQKSRARLLTVGIYFLENLIPPPVLDICILKMLRQSRADLGKIINIR